MFGSVLFLSALVSAPEFPKAAERKLFGTYPTWAVRDGKSAASLMELIVEADGKVRECAVVSFVGDERLAQDECDRAKRLRLTPARGADGEPMLGRLRTHIRLWVQGSKQRLEVQSATWAPDISLKVVSAGTEAIEPSYFSLALQVDSEGAGLQCEGMQNSASYDRAVVEQACKEALNLTGPILMDKTGAPAPYVTNLRVLVEPTTTPS